MHEKMKIVGSCSRSNVGRQKNMFLQMSSFSTDCPVLDVREWQTLVSDRHEQTKPDSPSNDGHAKHILLSTDIGP